MRILILILTGLCLMTSGCATIQPMTPLERRAVESRDLNASYDNAYRATLTVLQDKGFTISNSDYQGGVIRASSGKTSSTFGSIFDGNVIDIFNSKNTAYDSSDITVTLEKYTDTITKMRILVVGHRFDSEGRLISSVRSDNPQDFQEYYSAIQKEIFMREQLEKR